MAKKKNDNSSKNDNSKPKSGPQLKPGRKISTVQKIKNLDDNVVKKILEDKKEEMSVAALDIAREMASRMDLEITKDLTDQQNEAALLYASGFSIVEVAEKIGTSNTQIEKWMKLPHFMKAVNGYTFSEGLVVKNNRIRIESRFLENIKDSILAKIENNELDGMSLATLFKLWQDLNVGFSAKVDKAEDTKDASSVQIMIVNHFKSQGKEYDTLDQFLQDPTFDFRKKTIDIESEEV